MLLFKINLATWSFGRVLTVGPDSFHQALQCDYIVLDHLFVLFSTIFPFFCVHKPDFAPKLCDPQYKNCCVHFSVLQLLLKCMKERLNKYFLIWTKFDSVDAEARVCRFYGEIYESLITVWLPVASLTVYRWCLSLESVTDRIVIFRPSLWIREVISVDVVTWNLRGENLRWLRSFSMLGKVMNFLTWRWLDLSFKGGMTVLCLWWVIIPPNSLLELSMTSHFPSKWLPPLYSHICLLQCCSLVKGPLAPWGEEYFSSLLFP